MTELVRKGLQCGEHKKNNNCVIHPSVQDSHRESVVGSESMVKLDFDETMFYVRQEHGRNLKTVYRTLPSLHLPLKINLRSVRLNILVHPLHSCSNFGSVKIRCSSRRRKNSNLE